MKLAVALLLTAAGTLLVLAGGPLLVTAGVIVLGTTYMHMVELQHQCLHHSAFRRAAPHRTVGALLGLPMFSSYSHYRIQHLRHHRYLGTDQDTEFFGFDARQRLTVGVLLRGMFDYPRLVAVARHSYRSWRGTWTYDQGQVSERIRRESMFEYRLMALVVTVAVGAAVAGYWDLVLLLWVAPLLLVATPLHFLVELPEHVRCDNDTTDVLRNTRSITGSWFSRWLTNGNNLHVEHHAAMTVPINRLGERHAEVRALAKHVERTYWSFYLGVAREVMAGLRGKPSAEGDGETMGYTGVVAQGGPVDVRELARLTITKVAVNEDNNAYLLRCRVTGRQLLIDAAGEPERLLELAGPAGLDTVVTTHAHEDHWGALTEVVKNTGAESLAHPDDAAGIPVVTGTVTDADSVQVGDCSLEVIHLDGHTPGSIALLYRDPAGTAHLFTGDSLFPGGVGNTEGDAQRFTSLLGDVERRLFDRLPDDTWFYPGHGRDSTLGAQRPYLAEWRARGW